MTRRVVITGYGAVSCLGSDVETLWNNIKASKSGIKKVEFEGYEGINSKIDGCYNSILAPKMVLDIKNVRK